MDNIFSGGIFLVAPLLSFSSFLAYGSDILTFFCPPPAGVISIFV
jgi:hypothetical protein